MHAPQVSQLTTNSLVDHRLVQFSLFVSAPLYFCNAGRQYCITFSVGSSNVFGPTLPYLEAPLSATLVAPSCQLASVRNGRHGRRGPSAARACVHPQNDYRRGRAVNRRHGAGATFVLVAYLGAGRESELPQGLYAVDVVTLWRLSFLLCMFLRPTFRPHFLTVL